MKIAMIMTFLLSLASVSVSANKTEEAYRVGYIVGGHRMMAAMARQGREIRETVKAKLQPRLLFFAVAAVAVTLCGPELAERLRRRIKGMFNITKQAETALAWIGYLAVTSGIMAYGLVGYGVNGSVPIAILLAGTVWPFVEVLRGIRDDDRAVRKSGFAKIKTLLFLCLVVILVYRLLSDTGFGNIKIG